MHVSHTLDPIFDSTSKVLVLGTMPSPISREVAFYYGNPRNRFWDVLAKLFDEEIGSSNEQRIQFLLKHHIAIWDVLASCEITGASDASITDAIPNDLSCIFESAPIAAIFTTGTKARDLYRKFNAKRFADIPHIALPSTSPANARMRLDDLVQAYAPLYEALQRN